MKTAIVHDWLTGMRGGEKVLEVFCELYPDADLYTLIHLPGSTSKTIESMSIKTSYLQRIPGIAKRYRSFLPLFPHAIEGFDLNGYDLVLSSSHCVAKGVIPYPGTLHISYIHSPMRYVWDLYQEYFGKDMTGWLSRKAISVFAHYLRMWDVTSSARVDHFIANSGHVARRVEKYYRRTADVIYPPVDCSRFNVSGGPGDFYLIVSAFAPYKRLDIAIESFNSLGLPLKIIGEGQDGKRLRGLARQNIEFLGWQKDDFIKECYSGCKALLFPGVEDFGIVPVEAMASGRPVIAFAKGGALETVVPLNKPAVGACDYTSAQEAEEKPTGIFFYEQTVESLIGAVRVFEENRDRFDKNDIRNHSLGFDRGIFKERISNYVSGKFGHNRERRGTVTT